jgi:CheY-like chemotaxis protein
MGRPPSMHGEFWLLTASSAIGDAPACNTTSWILRSPEVSDLATSCKEAVEGDHDWRDAVKVRLVETVGSGQFGIAEIHDIRRRVGYIGQRHAQQCAEQCRPVPVVLPAVNARDAMLAGGKLTIETSNAHLDEAYAAEQQEVQVGQYVMLAISDTGIGMSKEVIASAFDPFFTTKDIGQGTGLGLSQVYGFVKQSNGHVKICSEPGEGTTIRIYLPRLVGEPALVEEAPVWSIPSGRDGEIVLLVEDDAAARELNAGMLRELNYAVVIEAEDAARALQLIEMVPNIGLLFTDVGLPGGVTGRQLAEAARRLRPKLRVLFASGYARNAIVHHGRLDPGIDLISKPFSAAALASKIRELLDKA